MFFCRAPRVCAWPEWESFFSAVWLWHETRAAVMTPLRPAITITRWKCFSKLWEAWQSQHYHLLCHAETGRIFLFFRPGDIALTAAHPTPSSGLADSDINKFPAAVEGSKVNGQRSAASDLWCPKADTAEFAKKRKTPLAPTVNIYL